MDDRVREGHRRGGDLLGHHGDGWARGGRRRGESAGEGSGGGGCVWACRRWLERYAGTAQNRKCTADFKASSGRGLWKRPAGTPASDPPPPHSPTSGGRRRQAASSTRANAWASHPHFKGGPTPFSQSAAPAPESVVRDTPPQRKLCARGVPSPAQTLTLVLRYGAETLLDCARFSSPPRWQPSWNTCVALREGGVWWRLWGQQPPQSCKRSKHSLRHVSNAVVPDRPFNAHANGVV